MLSVESDSSEDPLESDVELSLVVVVEDLVEVTLEVFVRVWEVMSECWISFL